MNKRTNTSTTVEVRFEDGEVFGEKHRNSVGGFANMVRRVEDRVGERVSCRMVGDTVEHFTVVTGRTFRFVPVQGF